MRKPTTSNAYQDPLPDSEDQPRRVVSRPLTKISDETAKHLKSRVAESEKRYWEAKLYYDVDAVWIEIGKLLERDENLAAVTNWYKWLRPIQPAPGASSIQLVAVTSSVAANIQARHQAEIEAVLRAAEGRLKVNQPDLLIEICGNMAITVQRRAETARPELKIYSTRTEKSENAPAFLKRVYAAELAAGTLTLADLKNRDKSLWAGLRNWANAGKHDLDAVIPRGENKGGRPPLTPLIDPSTLDPNDPRDALALRAIRQRLTDRARLKKWHAAKAIRG